MPAPRHESSRSVVLWISGASVVSVAVACASSCGARTDLEPIRDLEGAGGATSSITSTASTTSSTDEVASSASSSSSSGPGPVCTTLGPAISDPVALTDPSGDALLTSLLSDGDKTFFASANNNDPSPDPTWRVRQVPPDLERIGPSEVVAKHPQSVSFSGMSLASSNGRRAGLFWDEPHGCRFVAINDDGTAGVSTEIDPIKWCYGLVGTPSGFQAFSSKSFSFMPLALLTISATGQLVSSVDVLPSTDPDSVPRGRAVLDDGTYVLAFSRKSSVEGTDYLATRVSPDGEVIVPPHAIVSLGDHESFALTSAGDHPLAVWSSDHAPGDVLVAKLDASGKPEAVAFVGHAKPPVLDLTIRQYGDGALVAWSDASDDSIQVVRVGPGGELLGSAIEIDAPGAPTALRVVPTNFGAMVGFSALAPGALTQVWATALPCLVID